MDAENKLNKILIQNRIRQQRFHKNHKEEINKKRREIYANGRAKLKAQQQQEEGEEGYEQEDDEYEEPLENEIYQTDFTNAKSASYEDIVNALNTIEVNAGSREKYKQDIKRLLVLTKCENFIKCLKDYKKIINTINNSIKRNGEPYSVNTKKGLYQMIVWIIDNLHIPISKSIKKHYNEQFEIYKISSNDETIEKQDTTEIPTFSDYLQKIKDAYGVESKIYVLSKLYEEVTMRDDFMLIIKPTIKDADDDDSNYIVVPKKENLTLIVNQYKTSNKYGQIKVKLSLPLSKIIRKYISNEKLNFDEYLFGNKPLSSFVSKMNKDIGITGTKGITLYRNMSVTDLLNTKPTAQQRQKLSAQMVHAPLTQLKYLRKN